MKSHLALELMVLSLGLLTGCGQAVSKSATSQAKSESTTRQTSKSATTHQSVSSKSDQPQPDKTQTEIDKLLTPVANKLPESRDTQNNEEETYSQFYHQGQQWYWQLTSKERGTIARGRITELTNSDSSTKELTLNDQGTIYTLNFSWLDSQKSAYSLQTDHLNIRGDYVLKDNVAEKSSQTTSSSQVDTRNLTTAQVNDWVWRQVKAKGPIYKSAYLFDQGMGDDGMLYIEVRENHSSKHMKGGAPGVNPRLAEYRINSDGELEENVNFIDWQVVATEYGD